jgi:hypothetical protein
MLAAFGPATAFAQTPPAASASEAPRRVVALDTRGAFEQSAVLEESLRELLGRLGLVLDARGSVPRDEVLALVLVEFDDEGAQVTVRRGRTAIESASKRVEREGSTAVFREALAHVVLGTVEPLAEEERDRPPPPPAPMPEGERPAPPPAQPVPHPPEAPNPWGFGVAAEGGASSLGSPAGAVGALGGFLTLSRRTSSGLGVALEGRYQLPTTVESPFVDARVSSGAFRLMPRVEIASFDRFSIELGGGAGIDILSVTPSSETLPASRLGKSTTRVDPVASAELIGRFGVAPNIDIALHLAADLDFATRRWVLDSGGAKSSFFGPAHVRPFVALGIDFGVLGTGRLAPRSSAQEDAPQ